MKRSRLFTAFVGAISLIIWTHFAKIRQNDGFAVSRLATVDQGKEHTPDDCTSAIQEALNQPYHYLASGAQSFAFVSLDGNYVLKFPKKGSCKVSALFQTLPLPTPLSRLRHKMLLKEEVLLPKTLASYQIANDVFRDETALIYVHLAKRALPDLENFSIKPKKGKPLKIDLLHYPFALQKKATPIYATLKQLIDQGYTLKVQQLLDNLIKAVLTTQKEGFLNNDLMVKKNFGFIGETAVKIDIGGFAKSPHNHDHSHFERRSLNETYKIWTWARHESPELTTYIDERTNHYLKERGSCSD